MNRVLLIGRLTKDLELRNTKTGKQVCEFTLAVNRDKEKSDFITCMVWNQQAENLCKYQGKGSQIAIMGELRVDSYEVDGNKKYKTYVLASQVEYLSSIKKDSAENLSTKTEVQQQFEYSDEDLPW